MGLLLTTDSEDEFVKELCELWLTIHEGDHFPETEAKRPFIFDIKRKLAGKYTLAERQALAALAIQMIE